MGLGADLGHILEEPLESFRMVFASYLSIEENRPVHLDEFN